MLYRRFIASVSICCIFVAGCSGPLTQTSFLAEESYKHNRFTSRDLTGRKIGFLPAVVPLGNEQYQTGIGNTLSKIFLEYNPDIEIIPPLEGINLINSNNLTKNFISIIKDYQVTGILEKNILKEIGNIIGVDYIVQVRLVRFSQDKSSRLSAFGLRIMETRESFLEMIIQIWDPKSGLIVWEGMGSATLASEALRAKNIAFADIAMFLSRKILEKLPA